MHLSCFHCGFIQTSVFCEIDTLTPILQVSKLRLRGFVTDQGHELVNSRNGSLNLDFLAPGPGNFISVLCYQLTC